MGKPLYDACVYIGRFQPFHNGHLAVLQKALDVAARVVVVFGGHRKARDVRNPWTTHERGQMVAETLEAYDDVPYARCGGDWRVADVHVRDHHEDLVWVTEVQQKVGDMLATFHPKKVALIGHHKDESSYYLKLFPQWIEEPASAKLQLDATAIRDSYFGPEPTGDEWNDLVPESVAVWMEGWRDTADYKRLAEEHAFLAAYRARLPKAAFPPFALTVDAVVVRSGHVLTVRRGRPPGKGQLALPGGFVMPHETTAAAVLRELREETDIRVDPDALRQSIKAWALIDRPDRDLRMRIVSHAAYFDLGAGQLPQIAGGDDAASAQWLPLAELYEREDEVYADHLHIVERMTRA